MKETLEAVILGALCNLCSTRRLRLVCEFFFTISGASPKEHLLRIPSSLWDLSQRYRLYFSSLPELVRQRLANYWSIDQAYCAKDPEALISASRTTWAVRCDAVDYDVTILVYQDWSTSCTGYRKYVENLGKETAKMLRRKAKRQGRDLRCEGPLDHRVTDYRDRLVTQDEAIPV